MKIKPIVFLAMYFHIRNFYYELFLLFFLFCDGVYKELPTLIFSRYMEQK